MAWKHYLEVDCEQTFKFVNASILEYLRLIFHFLYRDRSNPSLKPFDDVFDGIMGMYEVKGLLPVDTTDANPEDATGKSTLNFNDRTAVHDSVFATSVNAVTNEVFDDAMEGMNADNSQVFVYNGVYGNDDIILSRAQSLTQALRTVAGEVIRSSTLLILECDEFLKTTPNEHAETASRELKKLIQTVKAMECNRKLYFAEIDNGDATDAVAGTTRLQKTPYSSISWFHYFLMFLFQVGVRSPEVPPGANNYIYVATLTGMLENIELRVVPLLQAEREDGVPAKPYFCTQNYLLYWSHLVLTHCEADSRKVQDLKEYCKHFNSAGQLDDHRISQVARDREDRLQFEHERGNFMYQERWRKAYWEQNRQLRRDGHMLYVYSQKTRVPHLYTHLADTETGQVPLYYNPTDASGRGDLSNHGPDHEFWRQGTPEERRAARAAGARGGRDNRPAGAARALGLPPRNTPHTSAVRAAPNPAQVVPQGRRAAAPRAETDPHPQTRNMSKKATKAMKHQNAKEAASHHTRALTREEQAVLDIGLGSHLTRTARDEGHVVEELETLMIARNDCFKETKQLMEFYAKSNRDDETTELFLPAWDQLAKELQRLDGVMDNAVTELDQNSVKGQNWSREQTRRERANDALNARFTDIMQPDESPAAGSGTRNAAKNRPAKDEAVATNRKLTRQEEAVLDNGLQAPTARDERDIVDELETFFLERKMLFNDVLQLLNMFAASNRDEENKSMLVSDWESNIEELETLDGLMNTIVTELDPESVPGKRFILDMQHRKASMVKLNGKYNKLMAEGESPAAGS